MCGIIILLLAWIPRLFFFIIFLLSPSFYSVPPCFSHFLFIIIIGASLPHWYTFSSSSVYRFIVIGIPLHRHWYSSSSSSSSSSFLFHFFPSLSLLPFNYQPPHPKKVLCLSDAFKASKIFTKNPIFYVL